MLDYDTGWDDGYGIGYEKANNTAKRVYDQIDSEAPNGVTRGALQANLHSIAATMDHLPVAAGAVRKAAYRLDLYEAAAFDGIEE